MKHNTKHIPWSITEIFNGSELIFTFSNVSYEDKFYSVPRSHKVINDYKLPATHFITTFYERRGHDYLPFTREKVNA